MTVFRLGALPAVVRETQPRLSSLRMMTRAAPPVVSRAGVDPGALMLGNDVLGDCTAAGLGNHIRATAALAGYQVEVRDLDAIRFYAQSTGYVVGKPSTDQGGVESDVLAYVARNGFALRQQVLYPVWGTVDAGDMNGVRTVMASIGPAYLGVNLALADQQDGVWDTTTPGDQTPGSWGGHCLLGWAYDGTGDEDLVSLITWGGVRQATWRWMRSRIMECHGIAWRQLMPAGGLMSGEDWDALLAANAASLGQGAVSA